MKDIKVIGEIVCWLLMVFFLITLCFGMYGIEHYVIGALTVLLACPLLIKFVLKKINVTHKTAVRVIILVVCFILNAHAITHSYEERVIDITLNAVVNEIEKKYPGYDTIDVFHYYVTSKERTVDIDYLEVTIEFALPKEGEREKIKEKFDVQYDGLKHKCVKIENK